jgi:hypothetical protein
MAKLTYPAVLSTKYRSLVSEMRTVLTKWKTYAEKSPGAVADIRRQISTLMFALGGAFVDGTAINVVNSAGNKTVAGAANVNEATGVLTQVDLAATATLITNTQQVTCAVTGTYVSKFTATVAGGVITAIVLS